MFSYLTVVQDMPHEFGSFLLESNEFMTADSKSACFYMWCGI